MIKPTHYDDDGYPITWYRSIIPSNTLAAFHGLLKDCAYRKVLGENVEFDFQPHDECNVRVRPAKITRSVSKCNGKTLICLVGVQSNQFPRAIDLATMFLKEGLPVIVGGFHISGCVSMLDNLPGEISAAMEAGVSFFAGEAEENRLDEVLQDAWKGSLKPLYNHIKDLPGLNGQPTPVLPAATIAKTLGSHTSFDLGRGCPFKCSFCTIINVQGRKSRFRTPDDLERIIRENADQGVRDFFVTDDNLARNRNWEAFFDRLIALREVQGFKVSLIIQVDTLCQQDSEFYREGATRWREASFYWAGKHQSSETCWRSKRTRDRITEYRAMLQKWTVHGVYTWAGYIIGFPADTKQSVLRDIEILKRELPVDLLELFLLTPLPGSEDHLNMFEARCMDGPRPDKYDLHHRVTHHSTMSDAEWEETYDAGWRSYYSDEHIERVARRHAALGRDPGKVTLFLTEFRGLYEIEGIHPLEGGILRHKYRKDRRPGVPVDPPILFISA